jgi:hypothetical protein
MARRNSTKMSRMRNIEPAPLTLTFITATPAAPGLPVTSYIDLSQCASLASRRFYRQGLNWAIAGIKCSSISPGQVDVSKLPNTWVLANSWTIRPRFLDFKVYADSAHHALGFGANLLPIAGTPVAGVGLAAAGEWEPSKVIIPDNTNPGFSTEREFVAIGASYPGAGASGFNAVSLIEGYASSRLLPNILDPNAPDDAASVTGPFPENWMTATFNEGTSQDEEVIEDMITENNIAPYPFENDGVNLDTMYPGGANQLDGLEYHDFAQIFSTSATTNVGITRLKGGNFPCGLIRLDWTPETGQSNLVFQIDMIPGSHRGYLCESMQEM